MVIDPNKKVQIQIQIKTLLFDKTLMVVPIERSNYSKIFSIKNTAKHLKHTKINNYAIKLEKK